MPAAASDSERTGKEGWAMTTAGPNASGTITSDSGNGGTIAWGNPSFAGSDNTQYATAAEGGMGPSTSEYLKFLNFGFSIPAGSIINGIRFDVIRKSDSGSVVDSEVKTVKGGTVGGNNNAGGGAWGIVDEFPFYGGSADLWGRTWTYSDINANDFGIVYSVAFNSPDTAHIDFISCTITYTTVTATLTGTLAETTASVTRESHIVAGGRTCIITLVGDTWVASGATFDAQRQNIIDGMDSAQSEANGWDAEVKANEVVGAVVRTSNTVVTVTLTAAAAYNITATETIIVTIPATALTAGGSVVATPTFRVVPNINQIGHIANIGAEDVPTRPIDKVRLILPAGMKR